MLVKALLSNRASKLLLLPKTALIMANMAHATHVQITVEGDAIVIKAASSKKKKSS